MVMQHMQPRIQSVLGVRIPEREDELSPSSSTEVSCLCSQEPVTGPCLEPVESSPHPQLVKEISRLI
jgi:hypothetical protein